MDRRNFLTKLSTAAGVVIVTSTAGCGGGSDEPTNAPNESPDSSPGGSSDGSPNSSPTDPSTGTRTVQNSTATTDTPLARDIVAKSFDFETADDGHLVVTVPVENRADDERTSTLVVKVTADGETYTQSKELTLDAGETRTIEVEFPEVDMESTGSIGADISFED